MFPAACTVPSVKLRIQYNADCKLCNHSSPSPPYLSVTLFSSAHAPRELILPIAAYLGVPKDHVIANRMNWQWDDETGMPTKLVSRNRVQ